MSASDLYEIVQLAISSAENPNVPSFFLMGILILYGMEDLLKTHVGW